MTKKVVIAAAGQGTRMLHLTNNRCKHLIKVQKRPFLAYLLDNLIESGYRELFLVIGYKSEMMEKFISQYEPPIKGKKDSYNIIALNQYDILGPKEKEYGTACPVKCVKNILKNDDFIYLNGDNLYSVRDLKAINANGNYNYIGGVSVSNPEKYGVLITDEGFLKKIIEKPKEFAGNLINTGIYKFTPEIFKKVKSIKKSSRGEYEITDAVNLLAKERKVKIKKMKDFWLDFGSPSDVIKVSKFLKENGNLKSIPRISKEKC